MRPLLALSVAATLIVACGDGGGSDTAPTVSPVSSGGRLASLLTDGSEAVDFEARNLGPGDPKLAELLVQRSDLPASFSESYRTEVRRIQGGGELPDGSIDVGVSFTLGGKEPEGVDNFTVVVNSIVMRFESTVDAEALFIAELKANDVAATFRSDLEADLEEGEVLLDVSEIETDDFGEAFFGMRYTMGFYERDDDDEGFKADEPPIGSFTWETYTFVLGSYLVYIARNSVGDQPAPDIEGLVLARLAYDRVASAP